MKKVLSFVLCIALFLAVLPQICVAAQEEETPVSAVEAIKAEAVKSYRRSLSSAGKTSFHGTCGLMVSLQMYHLGINTRRIVFDGNDQYDYYEDLESTTGGYYINTYPASGYSLLEALNAVSENGTRDVRNLLVGFQRTKTEAGQIYGHALFINAIIDGMVYFMESFNCPVGGPEGTVNVCSIEKFANYYDKWTRFEGIVHFGSGNYYDVCRNVTTDLTVQTRFATVLRSQPAVVGQKDCVRLRSVAAGERLRATAIYDDNRTLYYQVQTNEGWGFLPAAAASFLQVNTEGLTLTDFSMPNRLTQGYVAAFDGKVTDESGRVISLEVCITDAQGQLVRRELTEPGEKDVRLSQLRSGLLFDLLDPGAYRVDIYAGRACPAVTANTTENRYARALLKSCTLQVGGSRHRTVESPAPLEEAVRDGWFRENGTWYCYADGAPRTGWVTHLGVRYYLQPDGSVTTGMKTVDGKQVYFSSTGALVTGWLTAEGITGYRLSDGTAATGWQTVDGQLYCFEADGQLLTDTQLVKDAVTYLLDGDGKATQKPAEEIQ